MGVNVKEWKGAWWVFVNHHGRRKAKRVGDRRTAETVAKGIRKRLAEGAFRLAPQGPPFVELAEEWLRKYPVIRSISQTSLENYTGFVRQHLIPYFGSMSVSTITAETVEDFISAKRGASGSTRFQDRGLSAGTVRSGLVALRLILERAVKAGYLPANPARGVGRFPRREEETVDPFTPAELGRILASAHQQDATFAALCRVWAQTGMRAGEVAGLRWGDLDLDRGLVVVQRTYTRGRIGPTKTRRARSVSLLHPTTEDTAEWKPGATLDSRAVLLAIRRLPVQALDAEAPLFAWQDGQLWHPMAVLRAWKRALRAAGVRYRAPEQLRHTFASLMLSRNAPVLYVQRQGGWRSAAVLLRVYARWMPQEFDGQTQPAATPAQPAATSAMAASGVTT
jgi:integrase